MKLFIVPKKKTTYWATIGYFILFVLIIEMKLVIVPIKKTTYWAAISNLICSLYWSIIGHLYCMA